MTDLELAEEIERHLAKYPAPCPVVSMFPERWQQIIAALRRGPELSVCPRCHGTGTILTSSFVDPSKDIATSCRICKGTGKLGHERPPSGEMVMVPREPTRGMLRAALDCPATPLGYEKDIVAIYRAMLSTAEAEVRKPYAHVMGACPLCGRTDPHSHTSGPLGVS